MSSQGHCDEREVVELVKEGKGTTDTEWKDTLQSWRKGASASWRRQGKKFSLELPKGL